MFKKGDRVIYTGVYTQGHDLWIQEWWGYPNLVGQEGTVNGIEGIHEDGEVWLEVTLDSISFSQIVNSGNLKLVGD